jgi:hypothetical protein
MSFINNEATQSSKIEGTQTEIEDSFKKESDIKPNPGPGNTSTDQNYCLTIDHHNICSIRNKINVHIVQDVHIVFFTETHLDGYSDSENILLSGFEKPIRKNRNSAGGGVIV